MRNRIWPLMVSGIISLLVVPGCSDDEIGSDQIVDAQSAYDRALSSFESGDFTTSRSGACADRLSPPFS